MNESEFNKQIDRLVECYGAKSYPRERIIGIWYSFRTYHYEDFKSGVNKIINECAFPPMVTQMKEHIVRRRGLSERVYPCEHCSGQGMFLAIKIDNPIHAPYAFRCNCPNGERFPHIPDFQEVDGFMEANKYHSKFPVERKASFGNLKLEKYELFRD